MPRACRDRRFGLVSLLLVRRTERLTRVNGRTLRRRLAPLGLGVFLWQLAFPASPKGVLFENSAAAAEQATILGDTFGSFVFRDEHGNAARPITVWFCRPAQFAPSMRIVFLMHGSSRTGRQARDIGEQYTREHGFVLLAPEFSQEHYPGRWMYDFGNMTGSGGKLLPEREWTFLAIEHLFDFVRVSPLCIPTVSAGRLRDRGRASTDDRPATQSRCAPQGHGADQGAELLRWLDPPARRTERDLSELLGIAKGFLADGLVTNEEARFLNDWTRNHLDATAQWPALSSSC